jgi:alpha-galactosidase
MKNTPSLLARRASAGPSVKKTITHQSKAARDLYSVFLSAVWLASAFAAEAATVRLDELDLATMSTGQGWAQKNKSISGKPLGIGGQAFAHGVGTHANSEFWLVLDGQPGAFSAKVGVDDTAASPKGSVEFIIYANEQQAWSSGLCNRGGKPKDCRLSLAGVTNLCLMVTDAGNGTDSDHADWAEATFEFAGQAPRPMSPVVPREAAVILTPPASAKPHINNPKVYGVRPGSPFLYRIAATGQRPMTFAASGLPASMALDAQTGIITGMSPQVGEYPVTLTAANARGEASQLVRIVSGKGLALTPPMGWNSWYIHYHRVSDKVMREAADQMVASGMADYGYEYVNIDDCWMVKVESTDPEMGGPTRDAAGRLLPNKRFPDMKAMTDYIHGKGLKAGTYTSPGPVTCAGYAGSYQHEAQDARTFADWGFDFLKYDWCSYGKLAKEPNLEERQKPYRLMWGELQMLDRDIVFNLCQYGGGEVWKWGAEMGHCWRTTGDLGVARGSRLPGFYRIGFSNGSHWEYGKPGGWNDPDYILIGWVGNARHQGEGAPTSLTPNEQYSYMSLWCLMAAPLVFSGDMAKLDPFTLNVLCNHEVIAVDQDSLGKQGRIVRKSLNEFLMVKELDDGSKAVGLFNLSEFASKLEFKWNDIGVAGKLRVRDLWRQQDLGVFENSYETTVPRHGVSLLRLTKP